jgi:site-specific recombinase XerD
VDTINESGLLKQFEEHLSNSALAPATVVNYLADLRAFLRWSKRTNGAACSLLNLATGDLQAYRLYLQETKGHAPTSINRRIQALRKFYDLFREQGRIDANPAQDVSLLREGVSERSRFLSSDDVSRLLEVVEESGSRWSSRDKAIILVLAGAGLKLSELTDLRLSELDLDPSGPCLNVGGPSAGSKRTIPLDEELCDALHRYLEERRTALGVGHLFTNRDGNPLSTRSVQRLLRQYGKAAGLDGLTTQALRYLYARTVYKGSEDLEKVAYLLGHRHLTTTIRYLRPDSLSEE